MSIGISHFIHQVMISFSSILFVIFYLKKNKNYTLSFTIILKLTSSFVFVGGGMFIWTLYYVMGVYEAELVIVVIGDFDGQD